MTKILTKYVTIGHARKMLGFKSRSHMDYVLANGGLEPFYVSKDTPYAIRLLRLDQVERIIAQRTPTDFS